jgi:hypothetical protein
MKKHSNLTIENIKQIARRHIQLKIDLRKTEIEITEAIREINPKYAAFMDEHNRRAEEEQPLAELYYVRSSIERGGFHAWN